MPKLVSLFTSAFYQFVYDVLGVWRFLCSFLFMKGLCVIYNNIAYECQLWLLYSNIIYYGYYIPGQTEFVSLARQFV